MKIVRYNQSNRGSQELQGKILNNDEFQEAEIKFYDGDKIYYVKLQIGDLFNLILALLKGR